MSSWIDTRAVDYKRQKASSSNNEGPDDSDHPADQVKDSQEDVVNALNLGRRQDAGDSDANAQAVSKQSAPGDEVGPIYRDPTSKVPIKQAVDQERQNAYSHGEEKGKQNPRFTRQDSKVSTRISKSVGNRNAKVSLAQQLGKLTGDGTSSHAHPLERPQDSAVTLEPRGVPMAIRLQELIQQAPLTNLPQKLTGDVTSSDAHTLERLQISELSLEPRGVPLALQLQELIQQAPLSNPPHPKLTGKKLERGRNVVWKGPVSRTEMQRSAIEDDIVGSMGSDDDPQGKKFDRGQNAVGKGPVSRTEMQRSAIEDDIVGSMGSDDESQGKKFDRGQNAVGKGSVSRTEMQRSAIEDDIVGSMGSDDESQGKKFDRGQNAVGKGPVSRTEMQRSAIEDDIVGSMGSDDESQGKKFDRGQNAVGKGPVSRTEMQRSAIEDDIVGSMGSDNESQGKKFDRGQNAVGKGPVSRTEMQRSAIEDDIVGSMGSDDESQGKKFDRGRNAVGKGPVSRTEMQRSAIEDDIVGTMGSDDESQGKKFDSAGDARGKGPVSSTEMHRSAIEDDIVGHMGRDDDPQEKSLEKHTAHPSALSGSVLWEEFRAALEGAPLDTNLPSTARDNLKLPPSGFSARLQSVLKRLKAQRLQFEKSQTLGKSFHGRSRCLVVLILGKTFEAQLTTCQCKVLQAPQELNNSSSVGKDGVEGVPYPSTVNVIFSSKISPDLELDVGGVVRIFPPWQEIQGTGNLGRIILSTFFCEMEK